MVIDILFQYYLETFRQFLAQILQRVGKGKEDLEETETVASMETEETVQELLNNSLRQTTSFSTHGIKGDMTRIEDI